MIVQELKRDVSTVRIHDEFLESDTKRLIGSVSRVVSNSYKRRYLSMSQEASEVAEISDHKLVTTTLQA